MLKFSTLAGLLLMVSLVFPQAVCAQEAELEMKFVGYGQSYQEIYISLTNAGEITISDITIYIDEEVYKTIEGVSASGTTFEEVLFLEPGEHLIEARTPEGAYASLSVTASEGQVPKTTTTTISESPEQPGGGGGGLDFGTILWIVLGVAVIVFVISIWLIGKDRFVGREFIGKFVGSE